MVNPKLHFSPLSDFRLIITGGWIPYVGSRLLANPILLPPVVVLFVSAAFPRVGSVASIGSIALVGSVALVGILAVSSLSFSILTPKFLLG